MWQELSGVGILQRLRSERASSRLDLAPSESCLRQCQKFRPRGYICAPSGVRIDFIRTRSCILPSQSLFPTSHSKHGRISYFRLRTSLVDLSLLVLLLTRAFYDSGIFERSSPSPKMLMSPGPARHHGGLRHR